jgi:hypothetical protein
MCVLVRRPPQHWPVLLLAAIWSLGTWLVYAATSRNYSGNCCSIRWFVPLLAPAYLALAVMLARMPRWRPAFVWLTMCGMLLMGLAWWRGPWDGHIGVAFWPIQAAALLGSTWRQVFKLSKVQQIENLPRRISVDEMPNRRHVLPARNQAV